MTDKEKISALAQTFPALRGAPGTRPFDEDRLQEWMGVCSGGERRAAAFILSVWNHFEYKFDVGEISGWDDGNLRAFAEWAKDPWWA